MIELKTEYRGWNITYKEWDDSWLGELDEINIKTSKGLGELKKKIDVALKKESKFKNMSVIVECRWGGNNEGPFRKVTITSVDENGECWVRTAKGSREKLYQGAVIYIDNDDNLKIISKMAEKRKQAEAIEQERDNLQSTLEVVVIPK